MRHNTIVVSLYAKVLADRVSARARSSSAERAKSTASAHVESAEARRLNRGVTRVKGSRDHDPRSPGAAGLTIDVEVVGYRSQQLGGLARLVGDGWRPRRSPFPSRSSNLMRSSTMTAMSSGGLRAAATTDAGASTTRTDSACSPRLPSATPNSTRLPGLSSVIPARQGRRVNEDVATVVPAEEAETLLGVEPLDLARRHDAPRSVSIVVGPLDLTAGTSVVTNPRGEWVSDPPYRAR